MGVIVWVSLFIIYYNFDGYLRVLKTIKFIRLKKTKENEYKETILPTITVLLTVYNEEKGIIEKIDNILKQEYQKDKLRVLVASDGSTDKTDELVLSYKNPNISLFRPSKRVGKSDTQNKAIETINDDIIIFTDCDTRFQSDCIIELIKPYNSTNVGCTTAHLLFTNDTEGNISQGQSYYWNYELQLRNIESELNCLAVATGACMSIRTSLFEPFSATYGEDCILPLDTIIKDYKVCHVKSAIAYDTMPDSQRGEFKARVRMTLRNWQGTWSRPSLLNPMIYPKYAFAIWSHKILRWLTPVFLIISTLASAYLATISILYMVVFIFLFSFYIIGLIGFVASRQEITLPRYFKVIYSFMLANMGFLVGLWQVLSGASIKKYTD